MTANRIPTATEYAAAQDVIKWAAIHSDVERAAARETIADYENALAGHTVSEVMAALGCDVRDPRGSGRAGSGGQYCATHREYATPGSCPAASKLRDRLEAESANR